MLCQKVDHVSDFPEGPKSPVQEQDPGESAIFYSTNRREGNSMGHMCPVGGTKVLWAVCVEHYVVKLHVRVPVHLSSVCSRCSPLPHG